MSGVHCVPAHHKSYHRRRFGLNRGQSPNAIFAGDRTISISLSSELMAEDVADVGWALRRARHYHSAGTASKFRGYTAGHSRRD